MERSMKTIMTVALASSFTLLSAASPVIGIAFSNGSILINNARTVGNATLFDGSTVETNADGSRLHMKSGTDVELAGASRGKVFGNKIYLEKGTTQVRGGKGYEVVARSLTITGADAFSAATVTVRGQGVQVASLTGHVLVANAAGMVLANVAPGMAFDFNPQDSGASTPQSSSSGNKKAAAGAGAAGAGAGVGAGTAVVAGIVVVAAVGTTAGVLATQGANNTPTNGTSPGRS